MQSAGVYPEVAHETLTRADVMKAIGSPEQMAQLLRARWQLRRCSSVAKSVRVRGRVAVQNYGRIDLADRVRIDGRTVPVELCTWNHGVLTVGASTFLNYGVSLSAHTSVSIGKNCLLGDYVHVMDSDFHDLHDHTKPGKTAPIVIEDNVWLATRCIVLKGVKIGEGSVVGAGSVVTDDIPPMSLAFGVPARVVRKL